MHHQRFSGFFNEFTKDLFLSGTEINLCLPFVQTIFIVLSLIIYTKAYDKNFSKATTYIIFFTRITRTLIIIGTCIDCRWIQHFVPKKELLK